VVRHQGNEVKLNLNSADPSCFRFAAFYADCVHKVEPITEGYRVVLVFNLLWLDRARPLPETPTHYNEIEIIRDMLLQWRHDLQTTPPEADQPPPKKLVYLLEHAYTEAELGINQLKGVDVATARLLQQAAKEAECNVYLALLLLEQSGSAAYDGWSSYDRSRSRYGDFDDDDCDDDDCDDDDCDDDDDDDDDDCDDDEEGYEAEGYEEEGGCEADEYENFSVDEIIDSEARLQHFRALSADLPPVRMLYFSNDELSPPCDIEDLEPDEIHFHEATGNEGVSFDRTYRRAVLVIWPQAFNLAIIESAGLQTSLPYLQHLQQQWTAQQGALSSPQLPPQSSSLWQQAHALAERILQTREKEIQDHPTQDHASIYANLHLLTILKDLHDSAHIARYVLSLLRLPRLTEPSDVIVDALESLDALDDAQRMVLLQQMLALSLNSSGQAWIDMLFQLSQSPLYSGQATQLLPLATPIVQHFIAETSLVNRPKSDCRYQGKAENLVETLVKLLAGVSAISLDLALQVLQHGEQQPNLFDFNGVVLPAYKQLIAPPDHLGGPFMLAFRQRVIDFLKRRINDKPQPPSDGRRPNRVSCSCEDCRALSHFMAQPDQLIWVFKAAENRRSHVEIVVRHSMLDLDLATDKKGRPYSLVCRKNQASYHRHAKQWQRDVRDLEAIMQTTTASV
jgi:hypothetical protein